MGQANSLPKQLEVFTKQHMNFLLQVKQQPHLLSDSDRTQNALKRYIAFMDFKATQGNAAYKDAKVDEIWMWHIHRIHPVTYIADCTAAYGYPIPLQSPATLPALPATPSRSVFAPTVDLVRSVARHREFIAKVEPLFSSSDEHINYLAGQYLKFMKLVPIQEPGKILIPTIGIDLIWHTHMMIPERYGPDMQAISGRILDHFCTLSKEELESNLEYTDQLWQKTYNEPYLRNKNDVPSPITNTDSNTTTANQPSPAISSVTMPIQTAATETILAPSSTETSSSSSSIPSSPPPSPAHFQENSTPSAAYNPSQFPETPSPALNPTPPAQFPETSSPQFPETSSPSSTYDAPTVGVRNEVTWDQDSGSLWLGGGWGNSSDSSSSHSGGDSGSSSGGGTGNGSE